MTQPGRIPRFLPNHAQKLSSPLTPILKSCGNNHLRFLKRLHHLTHSLTNIIAKGYSINGENRFKKTAMENPGLWDSKNTTYFYAPASTGSCSIAAVYFPCLAAPLHLARWWNACLALSIFAASPRQAFSGGSCKARP